MYDYQAMSKEKLIEHVKATSQALHLLKQECQVLTWRLDLIEKHKQFFQKEFAA